MPRSDSHLRVVESLSYTDDSQLPVPKVKTPIFGLVRLIV